MAGWVYLSGSVISLAAVALALQATLPQIAPVFQLIGDAADRSDCAENAVLLGCLLIGLTTVINSVGVRLMARINNVGVMAELIGVTVLIALLAAKIRRGPSVLFDLQGRGEGRPGGYLGPFLAAALMASYVFTDSTRPAPWPKRPRTRRRAPWAILQALAAAGLTGALLMLLWHPRGQRSRSSRAGQDQRRPALSGQGRARAQTGRVPAPRGDLRRVRLCLAVHAGIGPADVCDGPRQQPAVRSLAGSRAAVVEGADRPVCRRRRIGGGHTGREHQFAQRDRDALLGRDRLGKPGLLTRHHAALGCATASWRPSQLLPLSAAIPTVTAVNRRPSSGASLFFAGPMGIARQRDRGRLGAVPRHQHRLASRRDLWLRVPGAGSRRRSRRSA